MLMMITLCSNGLSTLATIVVENGDCRRIRRLSPVLATLAEFGDYSRQCGQAILATVLKSRHVFIDLQIFLQRVSISLVQRHTSYMKAYVNKICKAQNTKKSLCAIVFHNIHVYVNRGPFFFGYEVRINKQLSCKCYIILT